MELTFYSVFIIFLFLVKILFILCAIAVRVDKNNNQRLTYSKDRLDLIFVVGMSCLLIYFFWPTRAFVPEFDREVKALFFLYGIITLITADWSPLMGNTSKDDNEFGFLQNILGKRN